MGFKVHNGIAQHTSVIYESQSVSWWDRGALAIVAGWGTQYTHCEDDSLCLFIAVRQFLYLFPINHKMVPIPIHIEDIDETRGRRHGELNRLTRANGGTSGLDRDNELGMQICWKGSR
jgi:hypothetical protein